LQLLHSQSGPVNPSTHLQWWPLVVARNNIYSISLIVKHNIRTLLLLEEWYNEIFCYDWERFSVVLAVPTAFSRSQFKWTIRYSCVATKQNLGRSSSYLWTQVVLGAKTVKTMVCFLHSKMKYKIFDFKFFSWQMHAPMMKTAKLGPLERFRLELPRFILKSNFFYHSSSFLVEHA